MSKLKIKGKELRSLGFPEGPVISVAMSVIGKRFKQQDKQQAFTLLQNILNSPGDYLNDPLWETIASKLLTKPAAIAERKENISLNSEGIGFSVFGREQIEEGAMLQMNNAAKLPVAVAGALMPDAHQGYGLPIGGVLAVKNAVIPYGVGVDIGCRMCLSVFAMDPSDLSENENFYSKALNAATLFGAGKQFDKPTWNEVMDKREFNDTALLRELKSKAAKQLGSSGSGNHFVEFGSLEINKLDEVLNISPGKYMGLLSHSGSRGLGATIAGHYTKIAKQKRQLPGEAANLAWLSLDEEAGMEYWLAMNLAGDYASACHHIIHDKIALQLGREPLKIVENHHNFAWKEMFKGEEVIVHRKGATPAGKNVLGIIPGSMTAPGFIVKGKGEITSLQSAAHGAGRKMSRTAAIKNITQLDLDEVLQLHGVKLMGGGLDEAPFAYKDIEIVMQSQQDLVDIIGKFHPRIVIMDGASHRSWKK
ncbi:MAG: RtcB family protein [Ferruginibacter sp.]